MRKRILYLALAILVMTIVPLTAGANGDISVTVNGEIVEFEQQPIIQNNRTLVPMKEFFKALNYNALCYDDTTIAVYDEEGYSVMLLWVDDDEMWTKDGMVTLDTLTVDINDSEYVPVRAISEGLGADVRWDESSRSIAITYSENKDSAEYDETTIKSEKIKIGVIQNIQHPMLDASYCGFLQALKDNEYDTDRVNIDFQNAEGDMVKAAYIAESFAKDEKDLIFAISSVSTIAAANITDEIPIFATAASIIEDSTFMEKNGGNISGKLEGDYICEQVKILKKLVPDVKKAAIIYSEYSQIINFAEETFNELGIEVVRKKVETTEDVKAAMGSCVGSVDAIYALADTAVIDNMDIISETANNAAIPVVCQEKQMAKMGGLIYVDVDYYKLGYATGEMAVRYLNGEKEMPPVENITEEDLRIYINQETAEKLKIQVLQN